MKPLYLSSLLAVVAMLTACIEPAPRLEAEFGHAVHNTMNAQIINPEASDNADPVAGLDGRAARDAVNNYQKSFAKPEPAPNVFNLDVGSGGGE
ncbi:MAG TPA: hypothetical protein VGD04_10865 [Methylophilus sp.]